MLRACPCGGESYAACCGPALDAGAYPATAEALMRSRYSAFALKRWRWLVDTHDPRTRGGLDEGQLQASSGETTWLGLEIVDTWRGAAKDKIGKVEFIARFEEADGARGQIHERSRFRRAKGRWVYVDGVIGERP